MKTIEEITKCFETLVNNVIENANPIDIEKKEGRDINEMKKDYMRAFKLFLEQPEKRQKNLSKKMDRLESYIN